MKNKCRYLNEQVFEGHTVAMQLRRSNDYHCQIEGLGATCFIRQVRIAC